jgi:hypothetical protein
MNNHTYGRVFRESLVLLSLLLSVSSLTLASAIRETRAIQSDSDKTGSIRAEFFGTMNLPGYKVQYLRGWQESGLTIAVRPSTGDVFVHAFCSSRLSVFRIDPSYQSSLFWMRDTADKNNPGTPGMDVVSIRNDTLYSLGPTVGYSTQEDGLCGFSIPLDTSLPWRRFFTEPISDPGTTIYPYGAVRYTDKRGSGWTATAVNERNELRFHALTADGRIIRTCRIDSGKINDYFLVQRTIATSDEKLYLGGTMSHLWWETDDQKKKPEQVVVWEVDSSFRLIRKSVVARGDTVWNSEVVGLAKHDGRLIMPISNVDPAYHQAMPGLLVLDTTGTVLVNRDYTELTEYNIYGGVPTRNGDIVIYGSKGPLDPVGNSPYISKCYAFAARLSAKTGDIQWLNVYDDSANIGSVFTTGCITESGRIILAGQLQGKFLYCGIRDSVLITSVDDERTDAGVHAPDLAVSPVPTRDILTAVLRGVQAEACRFSIYDMAGRELLSSTAPVTDSSCTVSLSTASLPAGSYVLRCTAGRTAASQTIVIQR